MLLFLLILATALLCSGTSDLCYQGDEDCGVCNAGQTSFTATWILSGVSPASIGFERNASAQQSNIDKMDAADVISLNDPWVGLHVSIKYFCCMSEQDKEKLVAVLHVFNWSAITMSFSQYHCNVDHTGVPVYLHVHPEPQDALFAMVREMEVFLVAHGLITRPRRQPFHMTLARVSPRYPVDKWVTWANATQPAIGTRTFSAFWIGLNRFNAKN